MHHVNLKAPLLALALVLLLALAMAASASSSASSSPRLAPAPVRPHPLMLEISTRPWLFQLSKQYGRNISGLKDIPDEEWAQIKQRGFDIVWMMGVWQLGAYGLNYDRTNPGLLAYYPTVLPDVTQADIIGSPYAVVQYTLNPELGSDADLRTLRKKLRQFGLALMLDFVPNHSAVDAPWTSSNASLYMRAPQSQGPYDPTRYLPNGIAFGWAGWGGSWQDTAQYNYWNPALRQAMTQNLLTVASFADYIRCDMAFLLLNDQIQQIWGPNTAFWGYPRPATEFWADAIAAAKAKFPVQFLAEVYDPFQGTLQQLGFDYTYDKTLYDRLADGNLDNLRGYLWALSSGYIAHSAHFVENHDEPRAAAYFGGNMRADGAAMVTMTLPGMRFFNLGQREGFFNRLDIHLRRGAAEPVQTGVVAFYDLFTSILNRPVFHSGQFTLLPVQPSDSSWRLVAWKWASADEKILVVVDYSDTQGYGQVILSDALPVNGNDNVPVVELISNQTYYRSAKQMQTTGLGVVVNAWSLQMFLYH